MEITAKKIRKSLPEDLIIEILVKLPVKLLLRYKCVCKYWYDLIKSPNFINMHLKHQYSTTNNDCILMKRGNSFTRRWLSFHSYESSLSVISPDFELPRLLRNGSYQYVISEPCNGLICISNGLNFILCNPAIRELNVLPPPSFPCSEGLEFSVGLIGLGFDPTASDYKVVALFQRKLICSSRVLDYKAEIYYLSTNSWRQIDHDLPHVYGYGVHETTFNGLLHWNVPGRGTRCILSFDLSTEVFREFELPIDLVGGIRIISSLTVLNNSLALFAHVHQQSFLDIWVMKEYGVAKSWTRKVRIDPLEDMYYPLLLWKNEAVLIERMQGELVSCALDTHEMTDYGIIGDGESKGFMVYKESLISMK